MALSVNKVVLVGNLGKVPEVRTMQNGNQVATLSVATSESWKDASTGDWKDRTEWHKVVIFSEYKIKTAQKLDKGDKVYIEGKLETRKWQGRDGKDNYATEVVLRGYDGELIGLDKKANVSTDANISETLNVSALDAVDDDIPF